VKDFLRFCATTGKGVIKDKIMADSLNTFAEWFFAGFTPWPTPRFERLPSELFSRFLDTLDEHRGTLLRRISTVLSQQFDTTLFQGIFRPKAAWGTSTSESVSQILSLGTWQRIILGLPKLAKSHRHGRYASGRPAQQSLEPEAQRW